TISHHPLAEARMNRFFAIVGLTCIFAPWAISGEIVWEPNIEFSNPDNQHLLLNLARPKDAAGSLPAIVCIHGGGFRAGNRGGWDARCTEFAARGYVAVTIEYRLSPKYQF